ncbi:helix-turn-helix domain-containing protein [Rhizobium sp. G21]|uniref:helix-turn-helix domain-containing protein n=1 Tax=Rhizobium sp. G21 TaxID=2758439 RepID=UPI0015FF6FEE|nr:helix-turn-helix transcriptional regulator [Rhizobium sp. G21]MBB1249140.1 helix-turn-helix transcriptional regulator [Rhizobium sp. G21]
MDAKKIIGWNLRKLRVPKGWSQERLALEANVDRTYIGKVERGSENVTISTLEIIAKALGVPLATLLIEPEKDEPPPPPMRAGRKWKHRNSLDKE